MHRGQCRHRRSFSTSQKTVPSLMTVSGGSPPRNRWASARPAAQRPTAFENAGQRQLPSGDAESLPHQDGELIEQRDGERTPLHHQFVGRCPSAFGPAGIAEPQHTGVQEQPAVSIFGSPVSASSPLTCTPAPSRTAPAANRSATARVCERAPSPAVAPAAGHRIVSPAVTERLTLDGVVGQPDSRHAWTAVPDRMSWAATVGVPASVTSRSYNPPGRPRARTPPAGRPARH